MEESVVEARAAALCREKAATMGVAIGWGLRASKRSTSNRRSDLEDVAIGGWMKGDTFSLDPRDEDASVDFAFDHAGPGLAWASALVWKIYALGWIALTANVHFPDRTGFFRSAYPL